MDCWLVTTWYFYWGGVLAHDTVAGYRHGDITSTEVSNPAGGSIPSTFRQDVYSNETQVTKKDSHVLNGRCLTQP